MSYGRLLGLARYLPPEGAFFSSIRSVKEEEPKPQRRQATAAEIAEIFGMPMNGGDG